MEYVKDNGKLREIADELIATEPDLRYLQGTCRIFYQIGLGLKGPANRRTYADCHKVQDKFKEFMDADYVITFYESANNLTADGLRILMHHELLHIDTDGVRHNIRKHDIEDFRAITDLYGPDWVETFSMQTKMEGM